MFELQTYEAERAFSVVREAFDAQRSVYGSFGVECAAAKPNDLEGIHIVVARNEDGDLAGALRIHRRLPHRPLPVEGILQAHAGALAAIDAAGDRSGELCGLWVDRRYRGAGLSAMLVYACLALAPRVDVDVLVSLGHQYNWFLGITGLIPAEAVAPVPYPDARYQSTLLFADAQTLHRVPKLAQRKVEEIRRAWTTWGSYRWDPQSCLVYRLCQRAMRAHARSRRASTPDSNMSGGAA